MTIVKWIPKEVISARKLNNFGRRRLAESDKSSVADEDRLAGDEYYNSTSKAVETYHSGSGSTFNVTEASNMIAKSDTEVGIGSTKTVMFTEKVINRKGLCNTNLFITVKYLQYTSLASDIEAKVTDGTTDVSDIVSPGSNGAPTDQVETFILDTSGYAIDKTLTITVALKNASAKNIDVRGV